MRNTYILALLLFSTFIHSQNSLLTEIYDTGYYIFQLDNHQADTLYRDGLQQVKDYYFDNPLKVFDNYESYADFDRQQLSIGHYLIAKPIENRLSLTLFSRNTCEMTLVNNNTDLILQFRDRHDSLLTDQSVLVGKRKLPYDRKSNSYRIAKSKRDGIVCVNHENHNNYFRINETENISNWSYLMTIPLYRWTSYPFRFVYFQVKLLLNAFRNKRAMWNYTHRLKYIIEHKLEQARNRLNPNKSLRPAYITLSKPKYKIGDTLKFNAFILDEKNNYSTDSLSLYLIGVGIDKENKSKSKFLDKLAPSVPGSYNYELILGEDVDLLLDKTYTLSLRQGSRRYVSTISFSYTQYDLSAMRLEILNEETEHYKQEAFAYLIETVDENDLPILDGKLHLELTLSDARNFRDNKVFIPYAILDTIINVDFSGTTKFIADSSLFPKADFVYKLSVKLENEEGKELSKSKNFNYISISEELDFELSKDSIYLKYNRNGAEEIATGQVTTSFPLYDEKVDFSTDQVFPIMPHIERQVFEINQQKYQLNLNDHPDLLQISGQISIDSIVFFSINPRQIPFSYFLYRNNKEIERGYGLTLNLNRKRPDLDTYTLMIQYKWGSQVKNKNLILTNKKNEIKLDIQHQDQIYPGELVEIKIKATDYKDRPINSLTILAHSLTDNFKNRATRIKEFNEKKKYKSVLRQYKKSIFDISGNHFINYDQWREIADLDSIEYYNFLYPGDTIYRAYLPTADSVTQVAPFIFNNGETENPHIVYIDYQPVYFSWSTEVNPYSFAVRPGRHHLSVRTTTHNVDLGSILIRKDVKNILSIDISQKPESIKIEKRRSRLSKKEKANLYPKIAMLNRRTSSSFSPFIADADTSNFHLISQRHNNIFLGPLKSTRLNYHEGDSYSIPFRFENNYEYYFSQNLVKMKSIPLQKGYPSNYPTELSYNFTKNLDETAFTRTKLERAIAKKKNDYIRDHLIRKTRNKKHNNKNSLKLKSNETNIISTILFHEFNNSELQIYNGLVKDFHYLFTGEYSILYLNDKGTAFIYDSIQISPDGVNYYDLTQQKAEISDSLGGRIDTIIFKLYNSIMSDYLKADSLKRELRLEVNKLTQYKVDDQFLYGRVIDEAGVPIIGAAVINLHTNKGVATDFDGEFKLPISAQGAQIKVAYIGVQTIIRDIGFMDNDVLCVLDEAHNSILDEVQITAYRVPLIDFDQTSSVKTVIAESIARSPLKSVTGLTTTAAGISVDNNSIGIRGSRSNATNYYVDGIRVSNSAQLPDSKNIRSMEHITGNEAQEIYGVEEVYLINTKIQALEVNRGSSLRNNFSDEGFWQPNIITDENGLATLKVTFPDDITKWRMHFYAVSDSEQSGNTTRFIRSYKPLSSSLKTPKFLIKGDQSNFITKVQNYQSDSTYVESKFYVNDALVKNNEHWSKSIYIDSLEVRAQSSDTLTTKFTIETESGYKDGEQHKVPVLQRGMLKTEGFYTLLDGDKKLKINTDTFKSDITMYVEASQLQLVRRQINHIHNYEHYCNEQLASKLLALLIDKKYSILLQEEFLYDKVIVDIIDKLKKRYTRKNAWGWWTEQDFVPWISAHVTRALREAEKMGFTNDLSLTQDNFALASKFSKSRSAGNSLNILAMMSCIDTSLNIESYIDKIDTFSNQTFNDSLRITLLKIQQGQDVNINFIKQQMDSSMLGEYFIHYRKRRNYFHISNNNVMYTILAFKIFQKLDAVKYEKELTGMKVFLMSSRINGYFRNTYEAIRIIELLSEEIIDAGSLAALKPQLLISGENKDTINRFPYQRTLIKGEQILVENVGKSPMFFTTYSKYRAEDVVKYESEFAIETSLARNESDSITLERKQEADLLTTITCRKAAEYTMIEIPIPAGSSFRSKRKGNRYEVHREYYDDKVLIFCKRLPSGTHRFNVELKTNFSGNYTLNPAKVELMYFPTFYGNTDIKNVTIK